MNIHFGTIRNRHRFGCFVKISQFILNKVKFDIQNETHIGFMI